MPFLETPLYSHYHLFLRSFHARPWKSFRLSRPIPPHARFPLWETSRLLSLPLVKSSNAVAIFGIPCPPSSWNKRGTAQSRQKISKSLDKGVLETPSLPPPPFLSSYLLLSVQVATAGLRGNGRGNFGRCFLYICRGVELTKEQVFGMKFCSTARSTGGRSPGLTRLDIDFVKMPDRHHLYGRRVSGGGGEGGLDDLLGIDVVDVLFPPSLPPSLCLSSLGNVVRIQCLAFLHGERNSSEARV